MNIIVYKRLSNSFWATYIIKHSMTKNQSYNPCGVPKKQNFSID